ncbi:MAG: hypothetical protein ACRDRU_12155 [Pseudonocardiaceae bacterium]
MNGGAPLVRATARLVAVCAVLAGLFLMHGLPMQGCHGGAGMLALPMVHPAAAPAELDMAAGAMAASVSHSPAYDVSEVGSDAGESGALCVSTPPPPGWAGLLALLLGVSVVGLLRPPGRVTSPSNQRLRAPPIAGSALLRTLCLSRT